MNRLIMSSDERAEWGRSMRPIDIRPAVDAVVVYQDESASGEITFLSDPNGDPLMAVWSEDFSEWSVYYSE